MQPQQNILKRTIEKSVQFQSKNTMYISDMSSSEFEKEEVRTEVREGGKSKTKSGNFNILFPTAKNEEI